MKKVKRMICLMLVLIFAISAMTISALAADTVEPQVINYYYMCTGSNVSVYRIVNGSPDYNDCIGLMQKTETFRTTSGGTVGGMLYGYPYTGSLAKLFGSVYSATNSSYYAFGGTELS